MTTTAQQPATPGGTPDPASGTRRVRARHTKPTAAQTDPFQRSLPVAEPRQVLTHARMVLRHHRGELSSVIGLHALAAILLAAVIAQTVLMWLARRAAFIFGESVFADLRERFIDRASRLPLPVLERAGTGDLVARTTNDIEALSWAARFGLPAIFVALVTVVITLGERHRSGVPGRHRRERGGGAHHRCARTGRRPARAAPGVSARVLSGRVLHPLAADVVVRANGVLVCGAGRRRAAVVWLAGARRVAECGRRDDGDPVSATADRPAR